MDPDAVNGGERVPHGGEPESSVLDFSANINPNVPDGVDRVYADALASARRYPNDEYPDFRDAAATYIDCRRSDVVATPGGLAAIRLALECVLEPGDEVLVPYPSFGEYAREVRLQGGLPTFVPEAEMGSLGSALLEGVTAVVVCRPNNPTGDLLPRSDLEALLERCVDTETTLLVDEAFLGFTDEPSLATKGVDRLVVARSLTKLFGLPGLRAGFAVSSGSLGEAMETARRTWNVSTPAAAVGAHCMRDREFVERTRDEIASERARMRRELSDAAQYTVSPSSAPFLLLDVDGSVDALLERARGAGIAIRDARPFRGLDSHVRIAIKNRSANDRLLEVLTDG